MQPPDFNLTASNLRTLLPRGAVVSIARSLKLSHTAVSKALRRAKPSHPAVAEAVRLIKEAGSQQVWHDLNCLTK